MPGTSLRIQPLGTTEDRCSFSTTTAKNKKQLQELIRQLDDLRTEMLNLEATSLSTATRVHPENRSSAGNLLHYLALRRHDIRQLQARLAQLGLSSLGRTESHVINTLHAVMSALAHLAGAEETTLWRRPEIADLAAGDKLLERNTELLLGRAPADRRVRIMITMPSEAATDYELVRDLVLHGMDCMRINCAHDDTVAWLAMIENLHRAEKETGKQCRIAMDLAGPKLRTGAVQDGPAVVKCRPQKDDYGRVLAPARVWLTGCANSEEPPAPCDAIVPVALTWLSRLEPGDHIHFTDTRGARRSLKITEVSGKSRWAEISRTAYFAPGLLLTTTTPAGKVREARVGPIPTKQQSLRLKPGDLLVLTLAPTHGRPAKHDSKNRLVSPAHISVTLPEFFDCVRPGEPIWFDDGRIGGIIRKVLPGRVMVAITHAPPAGGKLGAGKGINVPDTKLRIDSLTEEDLRALQFVVKHADMVAYSFIRNESDLLMLHRRLEELEVDRLGIILKIETRQSFDNLPRLLLVAMRTRAVGVMIARGDLAIECGYQRLAEIQEEILWICEAAHRPVIWATQVLESLAKNGVPSRSEITDAAMGERAECVMLNKGPYIVKALRILDDILRRMQTHQEKKRSMLRKLHVATAFPSAR